MQIYLFSYRLVDRVLVHYIAVSLATLSDMKITEKETIHRYYEALVRKDSAFVGIFFAGVNTTGIFCISTCRARKPKFENVTFYSDVKDVLQQGYRPCKVCRPANHTAEPPSYILEALALLKASPVHKVTDQALRAANIQPERVRRWFNTHHGITFQAYQRMVRVNTAYQNLKSGQNVATAAHEAGYESLSGFAYTFKKLTGASPKAGSAKGVILMHRFGTPLGPMYVCATERGVCLLEFTDRRMLETELQDLQHRLQSVIMVGTNRHSEQLISEVAEYFDGRRSTFAVALHTPSTPFREQVWRLLLTVPYGEVVSYQQQATRMGKPKAVRAVASANGHNRVAIVIPCHRVIGSDGSLTGYAGGLDRKRWLLQHEGAWNESQQMKLF